MAVKKAKKKENLGLVVRSLREKKGITPAELADKVSVSVSHLSNIESGRRDVPIKLAPLFAKALKVNEKDLIKLAIDQAVNRAGLTVAVSVSVK
jgi:transcriptional regulator with XRE-family HTH domain